MVTASAAPSGIYHINGTVVVPSAAPSGIYHSNGTVVTPSAAPSGIDHIGNGTIITASAPPSGIDHIGNGTMVTASAPPSDIYTINGTMVAPSAGPWTTCPYPTVVVTATTGASPTGGNSAEGLKAGDDSSAFRTSGASGLAAVPLAIAFISNFF